ncbi:hypothetical protein [Desulforhabdus sp. TSK]|uniref:hypothetical protein n=1 Tax=Desulforhabdus sp. TSK TaxID=2925014 RepID=UPI001FC808C2|nr:hypothetical protein [Desulforhabdus sp. TSK]GKT07186.1 hypothetical protein DSTSK_04910 [Desulforhabdus sp. TSK]
MNGLQESRNTATETPKKYPALNIETLRRTWSSNRTARKMATILSALVILAVVGPCTITHRFGPYYGKTVDADTGLPIEGGVVLASFYTEAYTLGGTRPKFVDALEVMTDARGEFQIPAQRVWAFRAPHRWDVHPDFVIFKPGYGSFPRHKGVSPKFSPGDTLPPDQHVVMKLPRLNTPDEMKGNSRSLLPSDVPPEKMQTLAKMVKDTPAVSRATVVLPGIPPECATPLIPGSK